MGSPLISIVMPLYNKEKEVDRAIRSALSQTVTDFELIVINDGSTDNSLDVVRSCRDERIRIIDQANQGVSAARNRGISEAKADLVAFLDADDEWKPDFLETIMKLVSTFPEASVFATGYTIKQIGIGERSSLIRGLPNLFSEGILMDYFAVAAQSDPPLWTSAVAVKKEAITSIGGFPVGVTAGEDLLTWARLAMKYKIAYSIKPVALFWMPLSLADRPECVPQNPDIVVLKLEELRQQSGQENASLKAYIALWHRMRATIFIRMGAKKEALQELSRSIRLAGINANLMILLFVSVLPVKFGLALYNVLKRWRLRVFDAKSIARL